MDIELGCELSVNEDFLALKQTKDIYDKQPRLCHEYNKVQLIDIRVVKTNLCGSVTWNVGKKEYEIIDIPLGIIVDMRIAWLKANAKE